jgi:hypothetical protein
MDDHALLMALIAPVLLLLVSEPLYRWYKDWRLSREFQMRAWRDKELGESRSASRDRRR